MRRSWLRLSLARCGLSGATGKIESVVKLCETHAAIHAGAAANKIVFAGKSWEIYGEWTEDVLIPKDRELGGG